MIIKPLMTLHAQGERQNLWIKILVGIMRSISEKQGTAKNQAAKHNSIHILNPLDTQIGKVQFHGQTDRDDLQPKPQLSHSS